jgi:MEMO1 family protein
MSTRPPAVAGYFYDADADRLRGHINQLLGAVSPVVTYQPDALIVPHAGYVYSGSTAAQAYCCLAAHANRIRRVLLLGPAHRVYVAGMAIPSVDAFATPLGRVPLEREELSRIAGMAGVEISDEAHRQEHSLEVQLPFLQAVLYEFSLIPVLIGGADPAVVAALIDSIGMDESTLIVISSDLSHFLDYESARETDAATCARISEKFTALSGDQACGARAINGLMASELARRLGVELLAACNSGDTAGSRDRVVGYASFALH